MVIDAAKGVEGRTVKLMEVCRLRDTPILTFVNKLDREVRDPIDVMDEVESVLKIACAPITWPIGMGSRFKGVYHLYDDEIHVFEPGQGDVASDARIIKDLGSREAAEFLGDDLEEFQDEIELVKGASHEFDEAAYLTGELTPVYFARRLETLV